MCTLDDIQYGQACQQHFYINVSHGNANNPQTYWNGVLFMQEMCKCNPSGLIVSATQRNKDLPMLLPER